MSYFLFPWWFNQWQYLHVVSIFWSFPYSICMTWRLIFKGVFDILIIVTHTPLGSFENMIFIPWKKIMTFSHSSLVGEFWRGLVIFFPCPGPSVRNRNPNPIHKFIKFNKYVTEELAFLHSLFRVIYNFDLASSLKIHLKYYLKKIILNIV